MIALGRSRRPGPRSVQHAAANPPLRVTVIVPVLDEEARIGNQLSALRATTGLHEIIVVDGGSTDRTLQVARTQEGAGVTVITARRGRAAQMNAGAAIATGDVLVFLHADVRLPQDASGWITRALAEPGVVAGAFRTWTIPEGRRPWFGPLLHLADLRSRYSSMPYGDQALFVRASIFEQIGGFADLPLMEDLELCRRLRKLGRIHTVPASVLVSGRRFLTRPIYYTLLVNIFPLLFHLGMPPQVLAARYGNPR